MKLRYALLIALACLFAAPFAKATPVDPSVIINRSPLDATPFTGSFTVTLDSDGGANIVFQNALDVDITQLIIQFQVPLPTGLNTCSSDIFSTCGVQNVAFDKQTDLLTEDFIFTGGSISPNGDFSFSAAGFTGANPNVIVSDAPEPATILLLLTGGAMLIGFGRKW